MRIRSIKPEFWRSPDITSLHVEDRLLFIGLWSYVDDNGVGVDDEATIIGDLFAADMFRESRETVARVSRGLANLSERGLIVRYEVSGRRYLFVTAWEAHQRIDKPGRARFPRPDQDSGSLARVSRDSRETVATGAGDQGAGDQGAGTPEPWPWCKKHPNGTDQPCGPCRTARIAFEAYRDSKKQKKETVPEVRAPKTCSIHADYPIPCPRCKEGT